MTPCKLKPPFYKPKTEQCTVQSFKKSKNNINDEAGNAQSKTTTMTRSLPVTSKNHLLTKHDKPHLTP